MLPDNQKFILFGPPGCGKTTELRRIIRDCCERYGPDKVIATSFSKTAARNIAADRAGETDLELDMTHVGTMHALCYRMLDKPPVAESKIDEFTADHQQYGLSVTQKRTLDMDEPEYDQTPETIGDELLQAYNLFRAKLIPRAQWPVSLQKFDAAWSRWKTARGYVDFSDMIERCLEREDSHIPFFADVLIGDEGQDLTPIQHRLFDKWAAQATYTVIAGDDDQTIFGHTGATASYFLDAAIPAERRRVLAQSYRVPRAVHAVAESWIKGVVQREQKVYNPRDDNGSVRLLAATWQWADLAIADAQKQVAQGKSVMFLASCSYMLTPLIDQLRAAALPFWNPLRPTRGDWNPLGIMTRQSEHTRTSMADRIVALAIPDTHNRLWTWRELDKIVSILRASGILTRGAKDEIKTRAADPYQSGREIETDTLEKLFIGESFGRLACGDLEFYAESVLPAKRAALEFPRRIAEKYGIASLQTEPLITVGTIHSVKGGQADIVYLFPDISRNAAKASCNALEGRDACIRQFYVGVTRARESLVCCSPQAGEYVHLPLGAARPFIQQKAGKLAA